MGFRFRLHSKSLPGTPDIILTKFHSVIFVHGCFWHGHAGCARATLPKSNQSFWKRKIKGNKARDRRVKCQLTKLGWRYLVVWQCATRSPPRLEASLRRFLDPSSAPRKPIVPRIAVSPPRQRL
jgi:DNA mismatch endonuclease (patch repair protein)